MNSLVAAVTKLPPIKVPYGKQRLEASPPLVRIQGDRSALGGRWRWKGFVSLTPIFLCCRVRGGGAWGGLEYREDVQSVFPPP